LGSPWGPGSRSSLACWRSRRAELQSVPELSGSRTNTMRVDAAWIAHGHLSGSMPCSTSVARSLVAGDRAVPADVPWTIRAARWSASRSGASSTARGNKRLTRANKGPIWYPQVVPAALPIDLPPTAPQEPRRRRAPTLQCLPLRRGEREPSCVIRRREWTRRAASG